MSPDSLQLTNHNPPEHKDFTTEHISGKNTQHNGAFLMVVLNAHTHKAKKKTYQWKFNSNRHI